MPYDHEAAGVREAGHAEPIRRAGPTVVRSRRIETATTPDPSNRHGVAMPDAFQLEELDGQIALVTFDLPDKKVNTLGQAVLTELAGWSASWRARTDLRGPAVPERQARPVHRRGRPERARRAGATPRKEQVGQAIGFGHQLFGQISQPAVPDGRPDRRQLHGRRHRAGPGDGRADRLDRAAHEDRPARGQGRPDPRPGAARSACRA